MSRRFATIAGIGTAIIVTVAAVVFYWMNRGHSLVHAAEAGRVDPILDALKDSPNDAGLWELLGEAHSKRTEYAQAVQAYQRSIQLDPSDETTWWMMGIAEVCRNNRDGVAAVEAGLRGLNAESAREFARISPNGCCAFGGCGK